MKKIILLLLLITISIIGKAQQQYVDDMYGNSKTKTGFFQSKTKTEDLKASTTYTGRNVNPEYNGFENKSTQYFSDKYQPKINSNNTRYSNYNNGYNNYGYNNMYGGN